mmetsp:Transcript_19553/g.57036  ORF Transcript_19553/g.57036 Transcript_19553/m.57036 type:complete len:261 (-) Transcript_19553:1283-2065(-)
MRQVPLSSLNPGIQSPVLVQHRPWKRTSSGAPSPACPGTTWVSLFGEPRLGMWPSTSSCAGTSTGWRSGNSPSRPFYRTPLSTPFPRSRPREITSAPSVCWPQKASAPFPCHHPRLQSSTVQSRSFGPQGLGPSGLPAESSPSSQRGQLRSATPSTLSTLSSNTSSLPRVSSVSPRRPEQRPPLHSLQRRRLLRWGRMCAWRKCPSASECRTMSPLDSLSMCDCPMEGPCESSCPWTVRREERWNCWFPLRRCRAPPPLP